MPVSDYLLTEEFNEDTIAVEISDAGATTSVYGPEDFDALLEFFRQLLEERLNEYGHADRIPDMLHAYDEAAKAIPPGDLDAFRATAEELLESVEGSGFQIGRLCTIGDLLEDAEFVEEVNEFCRDTGYGSEDDEAEELDSLDITRDAHLIYQALTADADQT